MAKEYVVKSGDTLSNIARDNNTNVNTLTQINSIQDPNAISVGQRLILPGGDYSGAISTAKQQLESGVTWGTAWWSVKNAAPEADNAQIDKDLNKTFWSQPGAYEKFTSEKSQPFSLDLQIDTGTAQSTPSFIPDKTDLRAPDEKPADEVKIIELPEDRKGVEIVDVPEDKTKVEIVDAPKARDVDIVDLKGRPVARERKPEQRLPSGEPFEAFFERLLQPDEARNISTGLADDDKGATDRAAEILRDNSLAVLNPPELGTFQSTPSMVSENYVSIFGAIPHAWKEGNLMIERELLVQESRSKETPEEYQKKVTEDLFNVAGDQIDLSKVSPHDFYVEASGQVLVPADVTALTPLGQGTQYQKDERKGQIQRAELTDELDDYLTANVDILEKMNKDLSLVLIGTETQKEIDKTFEDTLQGLVDDIHAEANSEAETWSNRAAVEAEGAAKDTQTIGEIFGEHINNILDFSFSDPTAEIAEAANAGFFDMIKDIDTYKEYVKSTKNYNDYNDVAKGAVVDEARALEDFNRIESEMAELMSVETTDFFNKNLEYRTLSDTERIAQQNYYEQNKRDIDKILDLSAERDDVASWLNVNRLKAQQAVDKSIAISASLENFFENFDELISSDNFRNLITSYGSSKNVNMDPLIKAINSYSNHQKWFVENSDKMAAIALKRDDKEAAALLQISAAYDLVNGYKKEYMTNLAKMYKTSKELEKVNKFDDIAYHQMKAEVNDTINASRFMHPFKTWDLWKEHGAKEVIWEFVPKALTGFLEAGVQGTKNVGLYQAFDIVYGVDEAMKDFQYFYEQLQKNQPLPTIAKGALQITKMIGGAEDSMAAWMNDILGNTDTYSIYLGPDGKMQKSPMTRFSTWALSWMADSTSDPEQFASMKTKYDISTATLPDKEGEKKTYSMDEIMKLYGSSSLQTTLIYTTHEGLKKVLLEANKFKEQGIDPNNIPAGTEVVISVGDPTASQRKIDNEKERMLMAGEVAYDSFKTTKPSTIYDFVDRRERDKVIEISMINDFAGQGISINDIPTGTDIIIPKYDNNPSYLSWMAPEKRLEMKTRNPYWHVFYDELSANIGDPLTYLWAGSAFRLGDFIDMAGAASSRKMMQLARSKTPTGKVTAGVARLVGGMDNLNELAVKGQAIADWSHGLSEILRLKPVSDARFAKIPDQAPLIELLKPNVSLKDQASLATLSVIMTKFRGITLSKMLPSLQKKLVDMADIDVNAANQRAQVDVKKILMDMSDEYKVNKTILQEAIRLNVVDYVSSRSKIMKPAAEFIADQKTVKTIQDWLLVKGKGAKNEAKAYHDSVMADYDSGLIRNKADLKYALEKPEDFYSTYYRTNKDVRVIDIALDFYERTGLSDGRLRKLLERVPDLEKIQIEVEKNFIDFQEYGKYLSIYHQEVYNNLPRFGRHAYRELLQNPKTGDLVPDQATFDAVKQDLLTKYPTEKAALLRGFRGVQEWKDRIEWVRLFEEGKVTLNPGDDRVLRPITKVNDVELRYVNVPLLSKELQKGWGKDAYQIFPDAKDPKKSTFIANMSAYKKGGVAAITMDYGSVVPSKRLAYLYDTPVGRSNVSLKKSKFSKGKDIGDLMPVNKKTGKPDADRVTYGNLLDTAFMDSEEGWFNAYKFKDGAAFRSEFKKIMDKMVKNEKEEFVTLRSVRRESADRRSLVQHSPHANRLYDIQKGAGVRVANYLDIREFYKMVEGLKALYDNDTTHALYRELYDKLFVLKRNMKNKTTDFPLTPAEEMQLLLMEIKGKSSRPDFLDSFTLIKGLLSNKKFTLEERMKIGAKMKRAGDRMTTNKTNSKIDASSQGLSSAQISTRKKEVKNTVEWFDGEKLSDEDFAKKLGEEMNGLKEHLPKNELAPMSTDDIRKANKPFEDTDSYHVGSVIPDLFTYITTEKIGPEVFLDNLVKFSKELNSGAVSLVADITKESRERILNIVDDMRKTVRKKTESQIAFLTRPLPDSIILAKGSKNVANTFGWKNDVIIGAVPTPVSKEMTTLRASVRTVNEGLDKLLTSEQRISKASYEKRTKDLAHSRATIKSKIEKLEGKEPDAGGKKKSIGGEIGSLQHDLQSFVTPEIKKKMEPLLKQSISPSKWLDWDSTDLAKLKTNLLYIYKQAAHNRGNNKKTLDDIAKLKKQIAEKELSSIKYLGEVNSINKKISALVPDTDETKAIKKQIEDKIAEVEKLRDEVSKLGTESDKIVSERQGLITDPDKIEAKNKLLLEQDALKDRLELIRDDTIIEEELKNIGLKNDYENELAKESTDWNKIDKITDDIAKSNSKLKKLTEDEQVRRIELDHKVEPNGEITIKETDGSTRTLKNTENVTTSADKMIRNEIERRAKFEPDSLHGHMLKLQRHLSEKTDKSYITVGEELPEQFLNDVAAVDLALALGDIKKGAYSSNYFADQATLTKLYDLEIKLADKEKALNAQNGIVRRMEGNLKSARDKKVDEKNLANQTSVLKREREVLNKLQEEKKVIADRADTFAFNVGIFKWNHEAKRQGAYRRYNPRFNKITYDEYKVGKTIITKEAIDWFDQVKAEYIEVTGKDGVKTKVKNPDYGKTVVVDDYTDSGKAYIEFLRDNKHQYSEGTDWRVAHVPEIIDNDITTAQAVTAIERSYMKPVLEMLSDDSGYGLGIKDEDLMELMNLSFEFDLPSFEMDQLYRKNSWNAYERLMTPEEKARLDRFANKLERVYTDKGKGTDVDKRRNDLWDKTATNKYEPVVIPHEARFMDNKLFESTSKKLDTMIEDFDPDSMDAEDYQKLVDGFHDEADLMDEIASAAPYDPNRPRKINDIVDNLNNESTLIEEDFQTDRSSIVPERKREFAISMAGMLKEVQQQLGWLDMAPTETKGKWVINSTRNSYDLHNVQTSLLQMTDGKAFDNGNILPSVKASLTKQGEVFGNNTREFFDLVPEIYGAKHARSYEDFQKIHRRTVDDANEVVNYLLKKRGEMKKDHLRKTIDTRKVLKEATDAEKKLRREIGIESTVKGKKYPGLIQQTINILKSFDKKDTHGLADKWEKIPTGLNKYIKSPVSAMRKTAGELRAITDKLNLPADIKKNVTDRIARIEELGKQARGVKLAMDEFELDIKNKDRTYNQSIRMIQSDLEKYRTKAKIAATLDNVLAGTYKPNRKGTIEVREFTKEFVGNINSRLSGIDQQKKRIRSKLHKIKSPDGKHPLVRQYLKELADLDREKTQLMNITKVAIPWNVAAANGIKFTSKEIYNASRNKFDESYVQKMQQLNKIMAVDSKKNQPLAVLDVQKKLDVLFPQVVLGGRKGAIKELGLDWYKEWFLNADRVHPTEITLPRVDFKDLDGIDLTNTAEATAMLIEFFEKTQRQGRYPTIVDLTGKLKTFIDRNLSDTEPPWSQRVNIITEKTFTKDLKSLLTGRGTHVNQAELDALVKLKELFEFRQGVYLFGENSHGVTARSLATSFKEKALSKQEVLALKEIRKVHDQKIEASVPSDKVTSMPQILSRANKSHSMKLIGSNRKGFMGKNTTKLSTQETFKLANRYATSIKIKNRLKKEKISYGEAFKKMDKSLDIKDKRVMVIGGYESLISDTAREAIKDAIGMGVTFYFPKLLQNSEKAMMEYIRSKKGRIAKQRYDIDGRFKIGSKGTPGMVLFNNKRSLSKYTDKDRHMIFRRTLAKKYVQKVGTKEKPAPKLYEADSFVEFRSMKQMEEIIDAELSNEMDEAFIKNKNKLAPDFVKEELEFGADIDKTLARWVALERKDKIREDFVRISEDNFRVQRNAAIAEQRAKLGRELEKWELDLIERDVNKAKQIMRLINDYVFRFDMPDRAMSQIRQAIMDKVFYWSTLASDNTDSDTFKGLFTWENLMGGAEAMNKMLGKDSTLKDSLRFLKKAWVWQVLIARPSWYLWNNLGDSARIAMGVRDVKIVGDLQRSYIDMNAKFLRKIGGQLKNEPIAEALELGLRRTVKKFDPENKLKLKGESLVEIRRNAENLVDITDSQLLKMRKDIGKIQGLRDYRVFDIADEAKLPGFTNSDRVDEIVNFKFDGTGKATTLAGEVIDERTLEWMTASGLVQSVTEPTYARKIIESMPDRTFIDRIAKRFRILVGDTEMFASQLEQMRRQTMAFDLLYRKAFTIAEAERTIKRWAFDYRDVTKAGRLFRNLFPFYTFHMKSLELFFGILLKAGPGPFQAGQALLEAMDEASKDLPSYMKDRIELDFLGLKGIYFLPHFGIMDHVRMLMNPMEEFQKMVKNPLQAMFGLGFGPFPASLIEHATGEGYFDGDPTVDQLRKEGWSMEEIMARKKENDKDKAADEKGMGNWLMTYAGSVFPYVELVKKLLAVEQKNTLRKTTLLQSKRFRETMKFFGVNLIQMREGTLDEINIVWDRLNSLPPAFKNVYKKRLEEERPDLYKYLQDYQAFSWLNKINKMTDDELKLKEGITRAEVSFKIKYYDLENEQKGSGDVYLANNPLAKDALERYWATKGNKDEWNAGMHDGDIGKMKSLIRNILGKLGTASDQRISDLNALGIKHPFTKGLDMKKLYADIYDPSGELKVRTAEDLVAILEDHGVMAELADLLDTTKELESQYKDYSKISVDEREAMRVEDAKYYNVKNLISKILPSNIDTMPEAEAGKYWDKYNSLKQTLIKDNPEYLKRYEEDTPEWKRKYDEMNTQYMDMWKGIRSKEGEADDNFFKKFGEQPDWFKRLYFSRHPGAKLYFPVVEAYVKLVDELVKQREETGNWDGERFSDALNKIWDNQDALKAWDKEKPGTYNFVDKHRQVWDTLSEDDTKDYFDTFYQNEGDPDWDAYREFYFNKEHNEYKRITYPFVRKWLNLREKDDANDGETTLANDWFWAPKHEEARRLYGENNPLEDGKTKLDYQARWRDLGPELNEDRGEIYKIVLDSPDWFKNEYWRNHPERKIYYPMALEMRDMEFNESLEHYFKPENKEYREAWERDKPGSTANKRFWLDHNTLVDSKGRLAALEFYFDPKNADQIAQHEKNHPGANYAYTLWRMFEQLPAKSWLGRKKRRQFLRDNPELKDWWGRNKELTPEQKEIILKEEIYYTILDRVSADGQGRQYYLDYYKAKAEADQYLKDNPDLDAARRDRDRYKDSVDTTLDKLVDEYYGLALQEDKTEFLKTHPDVNNYIQNLVPPGIKEIRKIQTEYFEIEYEDEDKQRAERQKFLKDNPDLIEYWDAKRIPTSYWNDRATYDKAQTEYNKASDYFDAVKKGDWKSAEKLSGKVPTDPPDIRTEEGRWLTQKIYNEAMATWATTFGTYMSTYYFRSLPAWLRNEYYRRHPEAKIISYTPMSRSINNAVNIKDSSHPDLNWARAQMKKYGKDLPSSIDKQVQKIMVKWGEWEDRSQWSSKQWGDWQAARSARLNGLRQQDLQYLPLLRKELARANKMYSYSSLPIRGSRKYGIINPFLGAPVLLPELTVGLDNDIINNN